MDPESLTGLAPSPTRRISPTWIQSNDIDFPFPNMCHTAQDFGQMIEPAEHGASPESASGGGVQVPEREHQIPQHGLQTNDIGFPLPNILERHLGQMIEQAIHRKFSDFANRGGVQIPERGDHQVDRRTPELAGPRGDYNFDIDEIIEQYRCRCPDFAGRGEVPVPERRGGDEEDQIHRTIPKSPPRNEIPPPYKQEEAQPNGPSPHFADRSGVQQPERDDYQFDKSFPGLAEAGFRRSIRERGRIVRIYHWKRSCSSTKRWS